jgi:hypothetical protein
MVNFFGHGELFEHPESFHTLSFFSAEVALFEECERRIKWNEIKST